MQIEKQMALPKKDMILPKLVKINEVMKNNRMTTKRFMNLITVSLLWLLGFKDKFNVNWSAIVMIGLVINGPFEIGNNPINAQITKLIHLG